jgi:carboxylate-amine ligase
VDELDCVEDILDNGNGGSRQRIVYEANHDLREVMAEIVEKTTL